MKRPTRREMMQSLNLAHRDLGLLYDKPPMSYDTQMREAERRRAAIRLISVPDRVAA